MLASKYLVTMAVTLPMIAGPAQARDFLVITGSAPTQEKAQEQAALTGGWALDTDLYDGLRPGLFVVVRGPFQQRGDAERELARLKETREYRDAYVKDAGSPKLPAGIGEAVGHHALAAILGELRAEVTDHPGGGNPCEPEEPYREVRWSYVGVERRGSDDYAATRHEIDLGGFWVIERTGEIQRTRLCAE